eukprot:6178831-Pleurochrysis_carterae.AAC.2
MSGSAIHLDHVYAISPCCGARNDQSAPRAYCASLIGTLTSFVSLGRLRCNALRVHIYTRIARAHARARDSRFAMSSMSVAFLAVFTRALVKRRLWCDGC